MHTVWVWVCVCVCVCVCVYRKVTVVPVVTASVQVEDANDVWKSQIALCPADICIGYCLCSLKATLSSLLGRAVQCCTAEV